MEKNIAIFIMNASLSGAEKRFIRIASELNKKRDDVILIINEGLYKACLNDTEIAARIEALNQAGKLELINRKRGSSRYFNILDKGIGIYQLLRKNKIKLLHCSLGGLKYSFIGQILGIKVISEITSPDVAELILTTNLKYIIQFSDKIIAVSPGVEQRIKNNLTKINKSGLIKQLYCSPIPFFLPPEEIKLGLQSKENLIVYASRFIDRKNPVLFAKAASCFLEKHKDWNVAILGKGPLEDNIKLHLKKYIEEGRAVVEHTKDMYGYLKRSKIFVSLIYPDNYPSQSLLEAMYMNNAIVATDVGNTSRMVSHQNGFLLKDYDLEELNEVLNTAVSNESLLEEMGCNSAAIIKNVFSKDQYLNSLEEVYMEFVGAR